MMVQTLDQFKAKAASRVHRTKEAFSSKEKFCTAIKADGFSDASEGRHNTDLLPSPLHDRRWGWQHFFAYYICATFSPGAYNVGASLVSQGLTWWHCMIAAAIGSAILSVFVILNSRGAAKYFVGFPVYVRAAAGVRGASLYVAVRASVAIIYFAVQTYYGAKLTSVFMRAIFGNGYHNIPNHLPASAGITSRDLLSFFLFWMAQYPVMFLHPKVLRHLLVFKAVYCTISLFAVMGWAVSANGGTLKFHYTSAKTVTGSALVWPMISAINSIMGVLCPILINQPDVARYAKSYKQVTWSQSGGIVFSKVLLMFISTVTTASATGVLGKSYWNLWDLYDAILDKYWTAGARTGMVFACFGMMLAIVITNATTNSLPVGADLTGLLPKYLTIVRGQVLCAFLAPLLVPWKIIASASAFLTFLGSYTVFLMPICASMIVDYWIVRRGNFHVPSLYTTTEGSPYRYYKGWNLRMLAAFLGGCAFVVHGVAGSLRPHSVNQVSKDMYKLGFLLSAFMGGLIYWVLSVIWPPMLLPAGHEQHLAWEAMVPSEGYLEGESVANITGLIEGTSPGRDSPTKTDYIVGGKYSDEEAKF